VSVLFLRKKRGTDKTRPNKQPMRKNNNTSLTLKVETNLKNEWEWHAKTYFLKNFIFFRIL